MSQNNRRTMFGMSLDALLSWAHVVFFGAVGIAAIASIAILHLSARINAIRDAELADIKNEAHVELETAKAAAAQAGQYAAALEGEARRAKARTTQLETEIESERAKRAARILTSEQHQILGEIKGEIQAVNVTSANSPEPFSFASLITRALTEAGVEVTYYRTPPGMAWTGVLIYAPQIPNDPSDHPLIGAFEKAGILGSVSRVPLLPGGPADVPMILVGMKEIDYIERPHFLRSDDVR